MEEGGHFGQYHSGKVIADSSDEVARESKECKQHCPCTCMSGCSFQLIFERGSGQGVSGDTGFRFDWYSPEIRIPF